jgi:hypothetical protein
VYESGGRFIIIEAKGGKRYASMSGLGGRIIESADGLDPDYALQGSKRYIESIVRNMRTNFAAGTPEHELAKRMAIALEDPGGWQKFDYFIVSAKWKNGKGLRVFKSIAQAVAPKLKVIRSILF